MRDVHKSFWLGLVGGIPGVLLSLMVLAAGYLGGSVYPEYADYSEVLYLLGSLGLVCSVLGMVGGSMERHKPMGAVMMAGSGIGMLLFLSWFGAFSFIVFVIGGALLWRDHTREKRAAPAYPYPPASPGQPVPYPPQGQVPPQNAAPGAVQYCPRCGVHTEGAGQRYCNACGKKLV